MTTYQDMLVKYWRRQRKRDQHVGEMLLPFAFRFVEPVGKVEVQSLVDVTVVKSKSSNISIRFDSWPLTHLEQSLRLTLLE